MHDSGRPVNEERPRCDYGSCVSSASNLKLKLKRRRSGWLSQDKTDFTRKQGDHAYQVACCSPTDYGLHDDRKNDGDWPGPESVECTGTES